MPALSFDMESEIEAFTEKVRAYVKDNGDLSKTLVIFQGIKNTSVHFIPKTGDIIIQNKGKH